MNPPNSAPAIPSSIVTMKPPGSRPGINSFAITPTTRPNRIHVRIPIQVPPALAVILQARNQLGIQPGWLDFKQSALMFQQPSLTVESAAVADERPRSADDAVAGHHDGNGIRAVGGADGAGRGG